MSIMPWQSRASIDAGRLATTTESRQLQMERVLTNLDADLQKIRRRFWHMRLHEDVSRREAVGYALMHQQAAIQTHWDVLLRMRGFSR